MLNKFLICSALAAGCQLAAATDPFVGHWVWNAQKSPTPTITYSVKDLGENHFAVTGSSGDTVNIQADGVLRPSPFGGNVSLKKIDDHKWEMVRKDHGFLQRTYTISADDKTLQIHDISTRQDKSRDVQTTTYMRTAPGKGLLGEWKSVSSTDDETSQTGRQMSIGPFGENGLVFSSPAQKRLFHIKLDGKTYEDIDQDPEAVKGTTTTAKRINSHAIEVLTLVNGKLDNTMEYSVSDDGKTLTTVYKAAKSGIVFKSVLDRK